MWKPLWWARFVARCWRHGFLPQRGQRAYTHLLLRLYGVLLSPEWETNSESSVWDWLPSPIPSILLKTRFLKAQDHYASLLPKPLPSV